MNFSRIASNLLRVSAVRTNPTKFFFYVPVPDSLQSRYSELDLGLTDLSSEINDHLTLLYVNDEFSNCHEMLPYIKSKCSDLARTYKSLSAKVQGWAYFDGAENDGQPCTALVALVDVPGLEDLHVDLKRLIRGLGIHAPQNHGFNCHTTFAYLPLGTRLTNLPVLEDQFIIEEFHLSNDQIYKFKLGS